MENQELMRVVEALLFASEKPLSAEQMKEAFDSDDVSASDLRESAIALQKEYQEQKRGCQLVEVAGGFQFVTDIRFSGYVKRFYQEREKKKLSNATLETLSIIAYKQPVTRADVEFVRGVNVDGALKTLIEKGLVKMVGRKDVPGRPMLYGTTRTFLEHFGLSSIKELPTLTEFSIRDLDPELIPASLKTEMNPREVTDEEANLMDASEEKSKEEG